ncbi:glycoside hydrolase family 48 protein [Deinococcus misasensis]|uniref:glycoside hydrolase family 48 protein n=1 Tax=Deinococcus misasensis TaxID=392413 RepID=UPI000A048BEF|nr:glycoside hydrolase family 48 protein [Deinococcus misasensis]
MKISGSRTALISLLLVTGAVSCGTQTPTPQSNTTKATKQAFSASGYSIDGGTSNAWQGGYSGYLRVSNVAASTPITSFEFTFKFNGTTTMAGSAWNGTVTGPDASGIYTAKSPDWLQYSPISVGGKWDLGFNGNGTFSGITVLAAKINGQPLSSDTIKPTASLSANKTSVTTAPNSVLLTATAADNVGVAKVEFYDGSTKVGEDATAPYNYTFDVQDSGQNGTHAFMARAVDLAGNTGDSAKVNVVVNVPITPGSGTPLPAADSEYTKRFLEMYNKIKNPANGYFSPEGVPYHSVETLIVEAPDHGHETTSEAYSYWLWLEAMYGATTGNWTPYQNAWANMEKYIIPTDTLQPISSYDPSKPATYAAEWDFPDQYPSELKFNSVSVGQDPLANELKSTYGKNQIYGMHWLLDVDNWYGYGQCGDGVTKPAYINTFQRGPQESVWETVPHPSCDVMKFGGKNGFLDLFTKDASYSKQWRYTNAPDADARAVQAAYWAHQFAKARNQSSAVSTQVSKAAMMGDYLRYAMYDKYFKTIGCKSETCAAATGKDSAFYLLSWYYAWGGAMDGSWSWRIGSSHAHSGYQNPMAAYVLSSVNEFKPKSPTAVADWKTSEKRQLEFYRWLQSSEGAIAGGATNSWKGRYAVPDAGLPTFYGLTYDWQPVYHDPPSNQWFGFQAWTMERVAEHYYLTNDANAKALMDKWVKWALGKTSLTADGSYQIPSTLQWTGQPDTWNPSNPGSNTNLHVTVLDYTNDVGVAAAYAKTLTYYAAATLKHTGTADAASKNMAKALLDRMYSKYSDTKGMSVPEVRSDYARFDDKYNPNSPNRDGIYVPAGWTGKMANGDVIDANSTFISIRSKYKQDPDWAKVESHLNGGPAPTFNYHRFWAQADIALALAEYARFFKN